MELKTQEQRNRTDDVVAENEEDLDDARARDKRGDRLKSMKCQAKLRTGSSRTYKPYEMKMSRRVTIGPQKLRKSENTPFFVALLFLSSSPDSQVSQEN
ncbi:hypothetical protein KIN20_028991 [Parelaphostrongylus tenuis]|uniref:Uncharacterized protein n=1 Tax=Parelaphostrongylus tenuis TaxID=148309 RepID=A0AAD5R201_PARTN|nr:hypothetical protein KIN20_028991 [Parelaphostrongylus tenuis]